MDPGCKTGAPWLRLRALYAATMEVLEDVESPPELIAYSIEQILPEMHKPDAAASRGAFDYWHGAFNAARAAATREAIKDVVRTYVCSTSPHARLPYNIAQGLMKATTHTIWRKLCTLDAGRLRADPREAVRDAMMSPAARGQELMRAMVAEIAAETGETTDQLAARITGESDDDSGGDDDSGSSSGSGNDSDTQKVEPGRPTRGAPARP